MFFLFPFFVHFIYKIDLIVVTRKLFYNIILHWIYNLFSINLLCKLYDPLASTPSLPACTSFANYVANSLV